MSISSINSNQAALLAQLNIGTATQNTSNDVAALSSGNRIVSASTDVAALAAGTGLQSQVNVINSSISVAAQGSSLLQVADGGLAQIQSILQRQQAITASASSGSLSTTQLGFLDQEFQALTTEINNIASETNFNGVNLLNGSIQGGTSVTTNAAAGNANNSKAVTIATIAKVATAGDTFTVNVGSGPSITLTLGTASGDVATDGATPGGTTAADLNAEASNLAAALNNSGNPQLANFRFSLGSTTGTLQATYVGPATTAASVPTITTSATQATTGSVTGTGTIALNTLANQATNILDITTGATAGDIVTVNGVQFTAAGSLSSSTFVAAAGSAANTATNLAAALNASGNAAFAGITFATDTTTGNLYAYYTGATSPTVTTSITQGGSGSIVASGPVTNKILNTIGTTGLSAGSTEAIGTVTGNLFVSGGTNVSTSTNYGQAVDLSKVYGNASFTGAFGGSGNIGAFTATYDAGSSTPASGVTLSTVIGGITYTAAELTNTTLTTAGPQTITFTGANSGGAAGGSFSVTIQGGQSNITNQTQASQFASALNAGLAGVSAYQARGVTSFNNAFTATTNGTQTGTLQGAALTYTSNSFTAPIISSVSVAAPSTGSTDAIITAVVNGQTYTTIAGIGDTFKTNSQIVLENTSNPSQQLILTTGNTAATGAATGIAIDLSSSSNAASFQTALSSALGIGSSGAGLTFQVGTTSADTLGVTIGSATSSTLFGGQSIDVLSQADATTAATAVQNALNTVTALRATVGASEEQFNFASTALQSAAQNEGAAASNLLDTDVAATSTKFATHQVQLQAGIAVLAQANQLQQNLLKLIA